MQFLHEYCSFCAFYRPLGANEWLHPLVRGDYQKSTNAGARGHRNFCSRGSAPDLAVGYYENLLLSLKARYPQVHLALFFGALNSVRSRKFLK